MHTKKKLGILTVKEAEIYADDLEIKIFQMESKMENVISQFYEEQDEARREKIKKRIKNLDLHIKSLAKETEVIKRALIFGRTIENGSEKFVN